MRSGGLCVGGNQSTRRKPVWLADHMTISHGEAGYWTWVAAVRGECVTTVPARQQHSIQQLFSKEQETIFRKERFRTYKEMDNTNLHSRAMTIGSWNWPFWAGGSLIQYYCICLCIRRSFFLQCLSQSRGASYTCYWKMPLSQEKLVPNADISGILFIVL